MARPEEGVILSIDGDEVPLLETSLELLNHSTTGKLTFRVVTDAAARNFEMEFLRTVRGVRYIQTGGSAARIRAGRKEMLLTEWLTGDDPLLTFADGSQLQGHVLCKPQVAPALTPLADAQMDAWIWPPKVNIRAESMRRHVGKGYTTV